MKPQFFIGLVLLFHWHPLGAAEETPAAPPSAPAQRSAADLEKLAMPIALHPDPLIASILPAAAYPVEIVQAARFVKDTNNVAKVDEQPWDANVKAVAKFPDLIAKMDADIDWTIQLGQAFVDQPKELMDTIQSLRAKAQKAGTLKTSEQQIVTVTNVVVQQTNQTQVVTVTNQVVQVQPANPQVVYVPSYPSTVYYPPPAYNPVAPLITFGVGMAWGAVLANNCNWGYGHVDVDVDVDRNVNRNVDRNSNRTGTGNRAGTTGANQKAWKPDQNRMKSSGAGGASASARDARGWGSGQPSAGNRAAGPSTGAAGTRPSTGTAAQRPSTGTAGNRPSAGASAGNRSSSPSVGNRSSGGSAFGGSSSGAGARSSASRGAASRGGGGRGGGGGRR